MDSLTTGSGAATVFLGSRFSVALVGVVGGADGVGAVAPEAIVGVAVSPDEVADVGVDSGSGVAPVDVVSPGVAVLVAAAVGAADELPAGG